MPVVCVALLEVYVEAAEAEPVEMSGGAGQVRKYPPGRIRGEGEEVLRTAFDLGGSCHKQPEF